MGNSKKAKGVPPPVWSPGSKSLPVIPTASPKSTVYSPADVSVMDRKLRFRFERIDVGSPWCLSTISNSDHADLLTKLKGLESKMIKEVFTGRDAAGAGKTEPMQNCPNPAPLKRLQEHYGGLDSLQVIRITGARRLFGILQEHEFSIVWWDPLHEVWPSSKK